MIAKELTRHNHFHDAVLDGVPELLAVPLLPDRTRDWLSWMEIMDL